jgi:Tol biopolymer transport system component
MGNKESKKSFSTELLVVAILVIGLFALWKHFALEPSLQEQEQRRANEPRPERFAVISFSPDSKKLYLEYQDLSGNVKIGWKDLLTGKVTLIAPQDSNSKFSAPTSSADGKMLAIQIKDKETNLTSSQLAILDLDSKKYRVITKGYSYKQFPSFSPDNKKIIYARASHITARQGQAMPAGWDIYEVDVSTGIEKQLTNFSFFAITPPFYLSDGERFIFYGEYPNNYSGGYKAYADKYHENGIFIRSANQATPLEPLFLSGEHSSSPFQIRDGRIFFESRDTNWNYDLYVFENGVIKRLTDLKSMLSNPIVSPNGDLIAYTSDVKRNKHTQQWIMDVKNNTHTPLNFRDSKSFEIIKVVNQTDNKNMAGE